ncbi:MAG TPA: ABC-type transport auxiliary lipoprotein family protein [Alphaproteobacteria bacterium]|jgi:cholesterol transport system auxiliary component|nr:ABC-type transport auxiliary lipoprotein family protein [Alphaproteobacteria bacterium]
MTLPRRLAPALLAAGGLALLLGGCTSVLPDLGGPPPDLYVLTPKSTFKPGLPKVDWQLVVEEPSAAGGLDTNRIALTMRPIELQYFASSRWTERAPRMVQTLLVESFENSGRIVGVGREVIGLRSDFNLKSELREFQAEYADPDRPPLVRVRLNIKLVRQPRRQIVASRNIEGVATASGGSMPEIVQGFDAALGKVLRRTVEWALEQGAMEMAQKPASGSLR